MVNSRRGRGFPGESKTKGNSRGSFQCAKTGKNWENNKGEGDAIARSLFSRKPEGEGGNEKHCNGGERGGGVVVDHTRLGR